MKGYAYLDLDGNLVYKLAEYIEEANPGFFTENQHLIVKHWKFDTSDIPSMWRLLMCVTDIGISKTSLNNFVKSINFNMESLRANKV